MPPSLLLRSFTTISIAAASLSLASAKAPSELTSTRFSDNDVTPSPACLCAAPNGDVFVGIDLLGSLGKKPGKGRIVRLRDTNNDGTADEHTVFAEVDNPRGLIAVGNKLYVLHSVIPKDKGIMTGTHLSLLIDKNQDGKADGPPKRLVKNISTLLHNQKRGADHTTNGIRMGIDGWIYIAVGDFGMVDAEGTDGTKLTMLGGGIIRVRPDGSELESYTHGLRNIYDVAIDPFMNIFTRGNTNDGGGWNIRFIHQIQSAEYGYPTLFKNFTSEIIPALGDGGSGSGTGAMFFQEPGWPSKYNNVSLMGDWGRNHLFIHRITPDGPSFTQKQERYIPVSQFTDIDVDGSGRMYLSAWNGAGYKGNLGKGYIERVVPKNWKYIAFPRLKQLSDKALVKGLTSDSATARLHVQQEILNRKDRIAPSVFAIANDSSASAESRVAAIFTYAQLLGEKSTSGLTKLTEDSQVREFALRAMADRLPVASKVSINPFLTGLKDSNPRVQVAAAVGLGRIGNENTAKQLLAVAIPPAPMKASTRRGHQGGPHATPHSAVVVPHVAVRALIKLNAAGACLTALDGPSQDGALWALSWMYNAKTVDGLIAKLDSTTNPNLKKKIITALARLYQKEADYDGSWWWSPRPDTRGPHYVLSKWTESSKIEQTFRTVFKKSNTEGKKFIASVANKHRMNILGIGEIQKLKLARKRNIPVVGTTSIEDIILALDKIKGNPKAGKKIIQTLACAACHNLNPNDPIKAPPFNHLGSRLTKDQIAEAILKPAATISDSWVTVTMNDGAVHMGTLVSKDTTTVVVNNIAGVPTTLKAADVKIIAKQTSTLMGPALADELTLKEFVHLIEYLHSLK